MNSVQIFLFVFLLCFLSIVLLHFNSIHLALEDEKNQISTNPTSVQNLVIRQEQLLNSSLEILNANLQKELLTMKKMIQNLGSNSMKIDGLTDRGGSESRTFDPTLPPSASYIDKNTSSISVLLWEFPGGVNWAGFGKDPNTEPNYLGQVVYKTCDIGCLITGDKSLISQVDAVMYESTAYGGSPGLFDLTFPMKRSWQQWVSFGYEHWQYFPASGEPIWKENMDLNMTFEYSGKNILPISFACSWGGGNLIEDLLKPPQLETKKKFAVWIATNCHGGGASGRTAYVKELMEYIPIDCPGQCLHNFDLPPEWQGKIYDDHGKSMRNKIKLFENYRFVFVFENNNITDYVTEKIWNAYQAGAVPIYMGAPNIDQWIPDPSSILRTDKFKNARDLANYLKKIEKDDKAYLSFFEWKKKGYDGWSESFKQKWKDCVFNDGECRLCHYLKAFREKQLEQGLQKVVSPAFALLLSGLPHLEFIDARRSAELYDHISTELSIVAWIQPTQIKDYRIVDKNTAGVLDGWSLDVFSSEVAGGGHVMGQMKPGVLRLCGGSGCVTGRDPIYPNYWYHVAVVYSVSARTCSFYINGFLDSRVDINTPLARNSYTLRIGASARSQGKDVAAKWFGFLDEISIWDRALSLQEIKDLRFATYSPHRQYRNLLGYWTFDDGTGNVIRDVSENQNHLRIVGVPGWVEAEIKPAYLGKSFDVSVKKRT